MPASDKKHDIKVSAKRHNVQQEKAAFRRALMESEKVVLVSPAVRYGINAHLRQAETLALLQALDLEIVRTLKPNMAQVNAGHYLNAGVIERLGLYIQGQQDVPPDLVVVDASISPVQQRNLELALKTRVIDRHGVILEIFARRARSHEGRLQVELAHLKFQESRLVRSWTHLERQRGGLGNVGGPGESQLEIDRRLLRQQISIRERKIAVLENRRALQRSHRQSGKEKQVALVGYTNAGKTTLFNRLTGARQQADSRVFETLDTTLRRCLIAPGSYVVIGDTVGFIDDLPPDLVTAFHATLEEILYADLIIHLHDYHAPDKMLHVVQDIVADILEEVSEDQRPPILTVLNKCDDLDQVTVDRLNGSGRLAISAETGMNIDLLLQQVQYILEGQSKIFRFELTAIDGPLLSWLYRYAEVIAQEVDQIDGQRITLHVRLSQEAERRMQQQIQKQGWSTPRLSPAS